MSKPLRFTKAEMANAARISKEHNVVVQLTNDGDLLVFPDTHRAMKVDVAANDEPSALEQWRERRDADKARRRAYGQEKAS